MSNISLELIQYQNNDKFPQQLTNVISDIYTNIDSGIFKNNSEILKSNYCFKIENIIRDRFNLNVQFDKELHIYSYAAIIPFVSDYLIEVSTLKNLISKLFSGINFYKHINKISKEKNEYFKKIHNKKGFVDVKNARVGGYLSEVKHYIIIDFFKLKNLELTPEESMAVILHEIGHAFVGLENHHRLNTTNTTILDILENINNNKPDKAYYIFKTRFTDKDIEESSLGNNKDITDFYNKLARTYLSELKSQFINSKYDQTTSENLADSFVSRFNVGKYLVTGLNKIHLKENRLTNSRELYSSLFLIEVILGIFVFSLFGVIGLFISVFSLIFVFGNSDSYMTYDFPKDRYNRIKNGIINNLKNKNLPLQLTKDLVEQYFFIDNVIEKSFYFEGIITKMKEVLIPSNRDNEYYITLQQDIENNLNNKLYLKSAQIRIS